MLTGIVPMGGRAERWAPLTTPKELLPFGDGAAGRPRLIVDHVVEALVEADVDRVLIPILPDKAALVMRHLGTRLRNGAMVLYISAPGPSLMANVVACAEVIDTDDVLFAMPDTVFAPLDMLRRCSQRLRSGAELVLGVFPTDEPEDLDVVKHEDGWVRAVLPKPRLDGSASGDVWGVAVWGPEFTKRLRNWRIQGAEPLGSVFQAAAATPKNCAAVTGQAYVDLGCYHRYRRALVAEEASLFAEVSGTAP